MLQPADHIRSLRISRQTAESTGISMNWVVIPPGASAAIVSRNDPNEQESVVPYDPASEAE